MGDKMKVHCIKRSIYLSVILVFLWALGASPVASQQSSSKSYEFDGDGISRDVLENYLDRAITMVHLLTPDKPEGIKAYMISLKGK